MDHDYAVVLRDPPGPGARGWFKAGPYRFRGIIEGVEGPYVVVRAEDGKVWRLPRRSLRVELDEGVAAAVAAVAAASPPRARTRAHRSPTASRAPATRSPRPHAEPRASSPAGPPEIEVVTRPPRPKLPAGTRVVTRDRPDIVGVIVGRPVYSKRANVWAVQIAYGKNEGVVRHVADVALAPGGAPARPAPAGAGEIARVPDPVGVPKPNLPEGTRVVRKDRPNEIGVTKGSPFWSKKGNLWRVLVNFGSYERFTDVAALAPPDGRAAAHAPAAPARPSTRGNLIQQVRALLARHPALAHEPGGPPNEAWVRSALAALGGAAGTEAGILAQQLLKPRLEALRRMKAKLANPPRAPAGTAGTAGSGGRVQALTAAEVASAQGRRSRVPTDPAFTAKIAAYAAELPSGFRRLFEETYRANLAHGRSQRVAYEEALETVQIELQAAERAIETQKQDEELRASRRGRAARRRAAPSERRTGVAVSAAPGPGTPPPEVADAIDRYAASHAGAALREFATQYRSHRRTMSAQEAFRLARERPVVHRAEMAERNRRADENVGPRPEQRLGAAEKSLLEILAREHVRRGGDERRHGASSWYDPGAQAPRQGLDSLVRKGYAERAPSGYGWRIKLEPPGGPVWGEAMNRIGFFRLKPLEREVYKRAYAEGLREGLGHAQASALASNTVDAHRKDRERAAFRAKHDRPVDVPAPAQPRTAATSPPFFSSEEMKRVSMYGTPERFKVIDDYFASLTPAEKSEFRRIYNSKRSTGDPISVFEHAQLQMITNWYQRLPAEQQPLFMHEMDLRRAWAKEGHSRSDMVEIATRARRAFEEKLRKQAAAPPGTTRSRRRSSRPRLPGARGPLVQPRGSDEEE